MRRILALAFFGLPALSCISPDPSGAPREAPPAGALVDPAWKVQHEDSTQRFIALSIVDSLTVWVAGQPGLWGRTTDGGANWTVAKVPGAEELAFRDVHAFSAEEAFILSIGSGDASRICKTVDGGATWTRVDPADVPDARPGEGSFAASETCVGTRPGGLAWFVTGASQVDTRVMRSADYGLTWSEAPTAVPNTKPDEGPASVAFFDDLHGAAFGTAHDAAAVNVAATSDGGATWTAAGRALDGVVYGGAVVPGAPTPTLVAVSPKGSAWSADNGATWTVFDTANYWTAGFLSADVGWAGGRGRISRIVNRAR